MQRRELNYKCYNFDLICRKNEKSFFPLSLILKMIIYIEKNYFTNSKKKKKKLREREFNEKVSFTFS